MEFGNWGKDDGLLRFSRWERKLGSDQTARLKTLRFMSLSIREKAFFNDDENFDLK
jgi:hypothetical protein